MSIALVCRRGHIVYPIYEPNKDWCENKFCESCGAPGISECSQCGKAIKGGYWEEDWINNPKIPDFCSKCGHPFPWSLPNEDSYLASAARFLIDGEEEDAANVLLSCSMKIESIDILFPMVGDSITDAVRVILKGPRAAYDILTNQDHQITMAIKKAIEAILPENQHMSYLMSQVEMIDIDPGWRSELLEIARGRGVHNQATDNVTKIRVWNNLRFRSASEMQIAKALDRARVIFWPNCKARLGKEGDRLNREADFLVCEQGKYGILEVDGEPYHPPSRTVDDHERDRLFKVHGINVIEHFDARECYENPDNVVNRFLELLRQSR